MAAKATNQPAPFAKRDLIRGVAVLHLAAERATYPRRIMRHLARPCAALAAGSEVCAVNLRFSKRFAAQMNGFVHYYLAALT